MVSCRPRLLDLLHAVVRCVMSFCAEESEHEIADHLKTVGFVIIDIFHHGIIGF